MISLVMVTKGSWPLSVLFVLGIPPIRGASGADALPVDDVDFLQKLSRDASGHNICKPKALAWT